MDRSEVVGVVGSLVVRAMKEGNFLLCEQSVYKKVNDFVFSDPASAGLAIRAGRARPIAVTSAQRFALMPDVPTMQEQGFKDYNLINWFGLWLPPGASPAAWWPRGVRSPWWCCRRPRPAR